MNSIWLLNDADKRRAFANRAAQGAARTLKGRDILQVSSAAPAPVEPPVPAIVDMPQRSRTWRHDLFDVARKHGVTPRDITSHFRDKNLVAARHELFWRLRTERNYSFPRIAMLLGRDHSSVIHGFKRHAEKLGQAAL